MKTLRFTIHIDATPEKVFTTMLDKEAYKIWTVPFNEKESWYEGDIEEGAKILFLGPSSEDANNIRGIVSRVAKYIPNESISFEHQGQVVKGVEDTESQATKKRWEGSYENYSVVEKDGGTDLNIETNVINQFAPYTKDTWPKALESLKKLAETI